MSLLRKMEELRAAENAVISARLPKFRKILAYKGRTLGEGDKQDFESLAFNKLSRSVQMHLRKWQSGSNDNLLSAIAQGALNKILKQKYKRDKMLERFRGKWP